MSDSPPLAHLDVFPMLVVTGVVVIAAVLASLWIGADSRLERGVAAATTGGVLAGCGLWARQVLGRLRR